MKKNFRRLFELFFPASCDFCEREIKEGDYLRVCQTCVNQLQLVLEKNYCGICSHPLENEETSETCPACSKLALLPKPYFTSFLNDDFGQRFLQTYKFQRRKSYIPILADVALKQETIFKRFDAYVVFPMADGALFDRDFDPVLEPVKRISKKTGVPILKVLRKRKSGTMQHLLPLAERLTNVQGKYELLPGAAEKLAGKKILLIDDILTSGASLNEVTKIIHGTVPSVSVSAYTFGRSVLKKEGYEK